MSDRIAVMRDGRIEQLGDPTPIYDAPASAFVAGFIGQQNFFDGHVAEGGAAVRAPDGLGAPGASAPPWPGPRARRRPPRVRAHPGGEQPAPRTRTPVAGPRHRRLAPRRDDAVPRAHGEDQRSSRGARRPRRPPRTGGACGARGAPSTCTCSRADQAGARRGRPPTSPRRSTARPSPAEPATAAPERDRIMTEPMTDRSPYPRAAARRTGSSTRELTPPRRSWPRRRLPARGRPRRLRARRGEAPLRQATGGKLEDQLRSTAGASTTTRRSSRRSRRSSARRSRSTPTARTRRRSPSSSRPGHAAATTSSCRRAPYIPQMVENNLLEELDLDAHPELQEPRPGVPRTSRGTRTTSTRSARTGAPTGLIYDKTVSRADQDLERLPRRRAERGQRQVSLLDAPAELAGMYFWANGIDWNTTDTARPRRLRGRSSSTSSRRTSRRSTPTPAHIPQGTLGAVARVERRCPPGVQLVQGPEPVRVGARRARHRAVDGQLGHRVKGTRTPRPPTRSSTSS